MKLSLVGHEAVVSHNGRELHWCVKAFELNRQVNPNLGYEDNENAVDPFEQLNLYWGSLPNQKQDQIFTVYSLAYDIFENSYDLRDLMDSLRPQIQLLFDLHPNNEIEYWIKMKSTIRIPGSAKVYGTMEENIKASEQFGSREWPRESTYLKDDYWGLITLVMTLRTLYPIWGNFMSRVRDEVGNDMKEFYAFRLLSKTSIEKSDNFKTLAAYVRHYVPVDKIEKSTVAGYVSTEDFVPWIMGLVVVRRLSLLNYSGRNDKFSLVSSVWSYINQTMKAYEKKVNETIKDKNPEGGVQANDKDNKASNLELIKFKEPITAGDVVSLNHYIAQTEVVAYKLAPDLPADTLAMARETVNKLRDVLIRQPQVTLLQWVLSKEVPGDPVELGSTEVHMECVFPPRGIEHLDKEELLSGMTAACAFLWHNKFYDLAALLTASAVDNQDMAEAASVEQPLPWSKEYKEKLIELFPHTPRPSGKQQQYDAMRVNKKTCEAMDSIEELRTAYSEHSWLLNLPKQWLDLIPNHRGGRRFPIRSDIRNKLAEFTIALATRAI